MKIQNIQSEVFEQFIHEYSQKWNISFTDFEICRFENLKYPKYSSIQSKIFVQFIYECSQFNKEIKYNFEVYRFENSKYPKWNIRTIYI